MTKRIFIIGGTGFMGRSLTRALVDRGHSVEVLARPGSEKNVTSGAIARTGNPLDAASYQQWIDKRTTVIQLAGVAHPNPLKGKQFREIDFVCGREATLAAAAVQAEQLIYVSVAQPAPIMRAYVKARADVEQLIRSYHLNATVLRPWYVIGPGRRWPLLMMPLYWIFENQTATRAAAQRLGFVTIREMTAAMVYATENPARDVRVWEVPDIRTVSSLSATPI